MSRISSRLDLVCLVAIALVACGEDSPTVPEPNAPELRPLTAPENLVYNIEVLYNDKVRSASERVHEYERVLAPPPGCGTCPQFVFDLQPADQEPSTPETWGRDTEIKVHRNLFEAQDRMEIYELTLDIQFLPAEELGDPNKPGWEKVFATNVHLRLLTTPHDAIEVNGAQAEFRVYPAQGRWFIGEWIDLGPGITWGYVKGLF